MNDQSVQAMVILDHLLPSAELVVGDEALPFSLLLKNLLKEKAPIESSGAQDAAKVAYQFLYQ
jgi:hypothetical protein